MVGLLQIIAVLGAIACALAFGYCLQVLYAGDHFNKRWTILALICCVLAVVLMYGVTGIGLAETNWGDPAYVQSRKARRFLDLFDSKHWIMLGSVVVGYCYSAVTRKPERY